MVHIGGGVSGVDAIKRVTAVSGVLFIVWCLLFRYSIVYRRAPIPMRLYRASTRASTRALPRSLSLLRRPLLASSFTRVQPPRS
jgi:hypothetical protein